MADQPTYSTMQVAVAARELRQAAGTEEQKFTAEEVIRMLDDEIRILRERGFTDERIAELFRGFEIEVSTEQIANHAPPTV